MQTENKESILKKVTSKEDDSSLNNENTANCAKDVHIKAALKKFVEQELKYVEISNILYMHQLKKT